MKFRRIFGINKSSLSLLFFLLILLPISFATELTFPIDTFENITVNQNIFLGGQILLEVDEIINASILPTIDNEFNIGSAARRWKDGFFSNIVTALTFIGNNSQWSRDSSNVFLTTITDNVGIGISTPGQTLTVQGTINITADGTEGPNLFVASNSNVGIGIATPTSKLHIIGNINTTGDISVSGGIFLLIPEAWLGPPGCIQK